MQSPARLTLYAGVWLALFHGLVPRCAASGVVIQTGYVSAIVSAVAPGNSESISDGDSGVSGQTGFQLNLRLNAHGDQAVGYGGYLEASASAEFGPRGTTRAGARLGGHAAAQISYPSSATANTAFPVYSNITLLVSFEEPVSVLGLLTGDYGDVQLYNYGHVSDRRFTLHGVSSINASVGVDVSPLLGPVHSGLPQSANESRKGSLTFYFFEYTDPNEFDLLSLLKGLLKSDPVEPETRYRTMVMGTRGAAPSLVAWEDVVYESTVAIPLFDGYGLNADVYFRSDAVIPNGPLEGARVDGFTLSSSDVAMRSLSVPSDAFIPSGATIEYDGSSFSLEPGLTFDFGSSGVASLVIAGLQAPGLAPTPLLFSLQFVEEGATELDFDYDLYRLAGDFDANGVVDGGDFLMWQRGNSPNNGSAGDLELWKFNFGASLGAVQAIPEPQAILLLLFGAFVGRLWFIRR